MENELKMCLLTREKNGIIDYDPISWLYGDVKITKEITEATCKDSPEKTITERFEIAITGIVSDLQTLGVFSWIYYDDDEEMILIIDDEIAFKGSVCQWSNKGILFITRKPIQL